MKKEIIELEIGKGKPTIFELINGMLETVNMIWQSVKF